MGVKRKGPRRLKVQFYRRPPGFLKQGWRWRILAENGRTIGASSEGYRRRGDCGANLELLTGIRDTGMAAWVVEFEPGSRDIRA